MHAKFYPTGIVLKKALADKLLCHGMLFTTEKWQGVQGREMIEVINIAYQVPLSTLSENYISPNVEWANEHFAERVGRIPYNPTPSHVRWPFARKNNAEFFESEKFSHTYPERIWPKFAGKSDKAVGMLKLQSGIKPNKGIRFEYGDLDDVIDLLNREPNTRQAFLPIWFPEDTGVVHGKRVPCSLGYHFQMREGLLHCTYMMRSCDFLLHWDDDMYLAYLLTKFVMDNLTQEAKPMDLGVLNCSIMNFHCFSEGRMALNKIVNNG